MKATSAISFNVSAEAHLSAHRLYKTRGRLALLKDYEQHVPRFVWAQCRELCFVNPNLPPWFCLVPL